MQEFSSFLSGSCHHRHTCPSCSSTCTLGESIYSPRSTQQIPVHPFVQSLADLSPAMLSSCASPRGPSLNGRKARFGNLGPRAR
uniref:Uncharacterized protein n=1 Tax=Arundo donax TaxID=35708 RepID=A0A0A9CNP8_ARUDO